MTRLPKIMNNKGSGMFNYCSCCCCCYYQYCYYNNSNGVIKQSDVLKPLFIFIQLSTSIARLGCSSYYRANYPSFINWSTLRVSNGKNGFDSRVQKLFCSFLWPDEPTVEALAHIISESKTNKGFEYFILCVINLFIGGCPPESTQTRNKKTLQKGSSHLNLNMVSESEEFFKTILVVVADIRQMKIRDEVQTAADQETFHNCSIFCCSCLILKNSKVVEEMLQILEQEAS